jgi:hypothetical protein
MPPLPTIANVYRCAVPWFGLSPAPVNVMHFRTTDTSDVAEIVSAIGDAYDAITSGGPWHCLDNNFSATELAITPLDGVTAQSNQPLGTTMIGSASGELIPSMAGVVSFATTQRGPRGRGRVYVGPITESQQDGGFLETTALTEMLTGWGQWHAAMRAGSPSIDPVVASYVHADAHSIVSIRVDFVVGTQRRRLDALR